MAYIKEIISSNGDRTDFARALRDFFLNNTLAPFELVSEDYTTNANMPVVEFKRKNLKLKFVISYSTSYSQVNILTKTDKLINQGTVMHSTNENNNSALYRALQICLIKNEDTLMVYIASYNTDTFYKGSIILDTTLTRGENLIAGTSYANALSGTGIQLKEVESQLVYTPRPFHIGSPEESTLILSNQLAVNGNNGVYCGDAIGLKSAGGAKLFATYATESGTYFGVLADIVIPLGDRVEYTSEVSL